MDVVFINPPGRDPLFPYPKNRPPYDLLYMESYLYHKKIKTFLIDIENRKVTRPDFQRQLSSINARYYVINTTGKSHHFRFFLKEDTHIKAIIDDIRKYTKGSIIALTGETSTIYTQEYLTFDADCIIYDEPEYSLYEIVSKNISNSTPTFNL